jgi:hypothetical protein
MLAAGYSAGNGAVESVIYILMQNIENSGSWSNIMGIEIWPP